MFMAIFLLIIGLVMLVFGGEYLVKGAASLAKKWGVSTLVVGLTVVAFGTSMPELVVNIFSAFKGATDLAVGNIIGSNISNIFLILGVSALICPLLVKESTTWKEIPFAILAGWMILFMGNDIFFDGLGENILTRTDGLALIAVFIIFLYYVFNLAKNGAVEQEEVQVFTWARSIIFLLAGIGLLFLGGKILVDNAIILARLAGMSEALIGLTIVAVGTSLPELVTSAVAAYRKQADIAVGNIVGSNIFNIFWILGLTSTIKPLPFNSGMNFDILAEIIATLILFLFLFIGTKKRLDRWQGVAFIVMYVAYISFLIYRG